MIRCTDSLIRHRNRGIWSAESAIGEEYIGNSSNGGGRRDEVEIPNDPPVVVLGGERNEELGNSGMDSVGRGMEMVVVGERKNDSPPADDVCAICFGNFTIPFKTNCGHWFCGSCILQFWNYRASLQKCKCPICSCLISKLTPEACLLSRQEKEVIEVLENVHRYNRLFEGGVHGLMQNVLALPLLIKRIFQELMDPDRFTDNYHIARFVGLMVGVMYRFSPFDFIPIGRYAAHSFFELCGISLVVICCLIGLCRRAIIHRRMRRIAAAHIEMNL